MPYLTEKAHGSHGLFCYCPFGNRPAAEAADGRFISHLLLIIKLQYAHEGFLWNFHIAYLTHALLTFLLLFQQLFLTGDITAVALGEKKESATAAAVSSSRIHW